MGRSAVKGAPWGVDWIGADPHPTLIPACLLRQRAKISELSETTTRFGIRINRRGMVLPTKRTSWGLSGRGLKLRRSCSRCANNKSSAPISCDYNRIVGDILPYPAGFAFFFGRVLQYCCSGARVSQPHLGSPHVRTHTALVLERHRSCCPSFNAVTTCATAPWTHTGSSAKLSASVHRCLLKGMTPNLYVEILELFMLKRDR